MESFRKVVHVYLRLESYYIQAMYTYITRINLTVLKDDWFEHEQCLHDFGASSYISMQLECVRLLGLSSMVIHTFNEAQITALYQMHVQKAKQQNLSVQHIINQCHTHRIYFNDQTEPVILSYVKHYLKLFLCYIN